MSDLPQAPRKTLDEFKEFLTDLADLHPDEAVQVALLAAREYIAEDNNPKSNRVLGLIYAALNPALSAAQSSGAVPAAYCAWHPDRGYNFGTMAETEKGATSRLLMTGLTSGNHRWEIRALYAAPSDLEITQAEIMAIGDTAVWFKEKGYRKCSEATTDALHDALNQAVSWIEECGSDFDGRQFVLTEARAALKGFHLIEERAPAFGSSEYECDVVSGGLELLLAAVHANDPKREILVRIGDLMRDMRKVRRTVGAGVVKP